MMHVAILYKYKIIYLYITTYVTTYVIQVWKIMQAVIL